MVRFLTIRESSMRFTKVKCNGMVVDSRATSIFPTGARRDWQLFVKQLLSRIS